jgi:hypothetical protein
LHAYDAFIRRMRQACGGETGDEMLVDRAKLVALLLECEFVLPSSLHAKTKTRAGDRLDAFLSRCKE